MAASGSGAEERLLPGVPSPNGSGGGVPAAWSDDSDDGFDGPVTGASPLVVSGGSLEPGSPGSPKPGGQGKGAGQARRGTSQQATVIELGSTTRSSMGGVDDRGGGGAGGIGGAASGVFDMARDRATSVVQWLGSSSSILQTYMTREAKLMTLLVLLASVTYLAMAGVVIYHSYSRLRTFVVDDASVCHGTAYEEIKTNSVGYNMANIVVGCLFALWVMVRAVRLEKGALLVCVAVVIVVVVARSFYFAFAVAPKSLNHGMELASQIVFPIASAVMLCALPLSFKVSAGFGWRFFAKGVTEAEDVETMQRYKQLDACAKIDLFVTLNAFIALFFFVSDNFLRIYGFIVTAITIIFLLALNVIVKKRKYWALYAFYIACVLMPVFYVYTLTTTVIKGEDVCPGDLQRCLSDGGTEVWEGADCTPPQETACMVPVACLDERNTTKQARCNATVAASDEACCSEYGRCQLKLVFFDSDKPLILFLAVAGCLVRVLTVYVGYRQAAAMNVPGVQEMLRRGERNLKSFSLPTLFSPKSSQQPTNGRRRADSASTFAGSPQPTTVQFDTQDERGGAI